MTLQQKMMNAPSDVPLTDTVPDHVLHKLCASYRQPSSCPYSDYITNKCREFLTDGGRHTNARAYTDICLLADAIRAGKSKDEISRMPLISILDPDGIPKAATRPSETSIDLCASLLTMIDIGGPPMSFSGREPLRWSGGTLQRFLCDYFVAPKELVPGSQPVGKLFNAINLTRLAGIKIQWTGNLANHLRLADDEKTVSIFHHASFLKANQRSPQTILPAGLAEETLNTLSLLLPQNDPKTRSWISTQTPATIDPEIHRCGSLRAEDRRFEKFAIWHDRLVILKQAFDESRPQTISQWWRDRRDRVQWYTFWVAVMVLGLTIFFGMVQSVEGAVQIYLAMKTKS